VHESERNGLLKRQRMLGLAMSDMRQAESAARALSKVNPGEIQLKRALGTAVVVSYTRAFTQSTIVTLRPEEYEPPKRSRAPLPDSRVERQRKRSQGGSPQDLCRTRPR
jgi:hypothetical protein